MNQITKPDRRPVINRIVQGEELSKLLPALPVIGYVAHVVTHGSLYKPIDGPVFGARVATYNKTFTAPTLFATSVADEAEKVSLYARWPADGVRCKIMVYHAIDGAFEGSSENSSEYVVTVPREVKDKISQHHKPQHQESLSLPLIGMDSIPEDAEADQPDSYGPANEDDPEWVEDLDELDADVQERDFHPTDKQLRELKLAHDNMGHPTNADFARLLRRGNAKPEVAAWVRRNFQCDECQAHRFPKAKRPSAVPRSYRLNHVVGIDLVEIKDLSNNPTFWVNVICWGTGFQMVDRLGGDFRKTPENTWNAFVNCWVKFFGMPEIIVCDPGGEFQGYFAEMASSFGAAILPTDARTPWQNGRTERAGKEWNRHLKYARHREEPHTEAELTMLGQLCSAARNRYMNRSGYSPIQRVFGFSTRLPASLLSDDAIDPAYLHVDPIEDFQRAETLRRAALRAWAALDSSDKITKALKARHRKT